jgi:hypothetical protein
LDFARHQEIELIRANKTVVLALAAALAERGELSGQEIDEIISATLARDALEAERARRKQWTATLANAEAFKRTAELSGIMAQTPQAF